jgi:uncharacterized membrane protein
MRWLLALLLLIAITGPANAGLSACNQSIHPMRVALGSFDGAQWGSKGWWMVAPKRCVELVAGRLNARYYYLYATDEQFGIWSGPKNFCVTVFMKFTIPGRRQCEARGYYRLGFLEVDTRDKLNWTQTFSDPH